MAKKTPLLVAKDLSFGHWNVVHRRSGLIVMFGCTSQRQARGGIKELLNLPIRWDQDEYTVLNDWHNLFGDFLWKLKAREEEKGG